jgi:protein O-GlcNAc transferase
VPVDQEGRYVEQPWRLPSVLSWVPPSDVLPTGHCRAALGRPFTFGMFNRMPKITQEGIAAWSEILKRLPDARLLVKNSQLNDPQVREILGEYFEQHGVRPQVGIAGSTNHYDHLAAHWIPDVMLDPFPQGGGVSAFESLWMGVPLLTVLGERPSGRIAASLLHQVGLDDWAVPDVESYIERAVELAADPKALVPIREGLRDRVLAMPALDVKAYAGHVEAGFRRMWVRWCAAQAKQEAA